MDAKPDELLRAMYGVNPNNDFSKKISEGGLMDAKAKIVWPDNRVNIADPHELDARIVGFRIRPGHPWYGLGLSDPLFALGDAVDAAKAAEQALTDHEAALAELVAERDELVKDRDSWFAKCDEALGKLYTERMSSEALLTGLEALAGEFELWARMKNEAAGENPDSFLKGSASAYSYVAGELRTLASAGLEGK